MMYKIYWRQSYNHLNADIIQYQEKIIASTKYIDALNVISYIKQISKDLK